MGSRGPVRTPTPLLEARGSRLAKGRSSIGHIDGDCLCPDWLTDVGRAKWDELLPLLVAVPGMMKPIYVDALACYCEAFEEFLRAREKLKGDDALVSISEKGGEYQNPYVGIKNRAMDRMRKHGALFGMSPSEASRVVPEGDVEDEDDPMVKIAESLNS